MSFPLFVVSCEIPGQRYRKRTELAEEGWLYISLLLLLSILPRLISPLTFLLYPLSPDFIINFIDFIRQRHTPVP